MTKFKTAETRPVVTSDNNGQTNPCNISSHYRKFKIQDWSSRFKIQDSELYRKFKIQDSKVLLRKIGASSRFGFSKFCSDFSEQVQDSDFLSFAPIFRSKFKIRIFKVLLRKIGASSRFRFFKFCSDFSEQVQDLNFQSFAPIFRSKFKIRIFKVFFFLFKPAPFWVLLGETIYFSITWSF